MNLSVVIITKNEATNIERCIQSCKELADEIIIVDSFSTDDTQAICENLGVTFLQREFIDYSDAKNFGNQQAKGKWILSLDADEELSETLKSSIAKVIKEEKDAVYIFNRLTNYCGDWIKHCGWYPDAKTRLWKNGTAEWIGSVHETLKSTHNIIPIKGDILHYSYPSLNFHLTKINHFTDMMAKQMDEKGKKYSNLKLWLSPPFKFFKKFILQRGFLDGYAGFVVSAMAAYYVFMKYAKLKELQKKSH